MLTTLKLLMKEWWSLRTLNSSRFFIQHSLFFRSSRISSKDWKVPCKVARLQDSQSTSNIPAHMFQVTLIHRWKVCVQLKIHKFLQRIIRAENKVEFYLHNKETREADNTTGNENRDKIWKENLFHEIFLDPYDDFHFFKSCKDFQTAHRSTNRNLIRESSWADLRMNLFKMPKKTF